MNKRRHVEFDAGAPQRIERGVVEGHSAKVVAEVRADQSQFYNRSGELGTCGMGILSRNLGEPQEAFGIVRDHRRESVVVPVAIVSRRSGIDVMEVRERIR